MRQIAFAFVAAGAGAAATVAVPPPPPPPQPPPIYVVLILPVHARIHVNTHNFVAVVVSQIFAILRFLPITVPLSIALDILLLCCFGYLASFIDTLY